MVSQVYLLPLFETGLSCIPAIGSIYAIVTWCSGCSGFC